MFGNITILQRLYNIGKMSINASLIEKYKELCIKLTTCESLIIICCVIIPKPLAILAKNLPESANIKNHAQTLPPNCWT